MQQEPFPPPSQQKRAFNEKGKSPRAYMYMCVDGNLTTSVTYGSTEGRIEKDIGYRDA